MAWKVDPQHLEYLHSRGIHDDTAQRNKLRSVPGTMLARLGFPAAHSGLLIPYGHSRYRRIRLFPPVQNGGRSNEFWEPPELTIGKRFYFPAGIQVRLPDVTDPLTIVAGEIEALAVTQCGGCAIGLAWPWWPSSDKHVSAMHRSLMTFWRPGRAIHLVPPPEFWNCPERRCPTCIQVHQFAFILTKMGGRVFLVGAPYQTDGKWQGIAEYLARAGTDARTAWTSLKPGEMQVPRTMPYPLPSPIHSLPPSQPTAPRIPESVAKILGGESRQPRLRPGQDFDNGRLIVGVSVHGKALFLDSRGNSWDRKKADDDFRLPPVFQLPETFQRKAIRRHLEGARVNVEDVVARVEALFRTHVYWRHQEEATALALWTFGTYMFSVFPIYGYIWLTSAIPRSGKTTVLRILSRIAFHATEVTVDTTAATLYRGVAYTCPTVILDEVEGLCATGDIPRQAIVRLLNGGFERGNTVRRVEYVDKVQEPVDYPIYTPKALAGISRLPATTVSRSFAIRMWRKQKSDTITRFNPQRRAAAIALADLRDDLYRAALTHAEEVARIYDRAEEFALPDECDDRARDILEPLYAMATLIDSQRPAGSSNLVTALCSFARLQAGVRASENEEGELAQVVRTLETAPSDKDGTVCLTPTEIFRLLESAGMEVRSTKQVGQWLKELDLVSKPNRVPGKDSRRRYRITRKRLNDLKARFV